MTLIIFSQCLISNHKCSVIMSVLWMLDKSEVKLRLDLSRSTKISPSTSGRQDQVLLSRTIHRFIRKNHWHGLEWVLFLKLLWRSSILNVSRTEWAQMRGPSHPSTYTCLHQAKRTKYEPSTKREKLKEGSIGSGNNWVVLARRSNARKSKEYYRKTHHLFWK